MSLGPLFVLLGEVYVQVLCPFFNWVVSLPGVESCEFFIYFGGQNPCPRYHWQIYFPIQLVSFSFWCCFFWWRSFLFWWSPICLFFHLCHLLQGTYQWKYCCVEYLRFSCLWFPLGLLWYHDLYSSLVSILSLFLCMVLVGDWVSFFFFFACSCPNLPILFVEESIFTQFYASAPFAKY